MPQIAALQPLGLRLVARRFPRPMRRVEMQAQQKRPRASGSLVDRLDGSVAEQVEGQLIPLPWTLPFPETLTVRSFVAEACDHAALTDWSPFICTVQEAPVPLHAPPQPVKTSPVWGV